MITVLVRSSFLHELIGELNGTNYNALCAHLNYAQVPPFIIIKYFNLNPNLIF